MHVLNHGSVLPEHIDPIPMPDTCREAENLVLLLGVGISPKTASSESGEPPAGRRDSPEIGVEGKEPQEEPGSVTVLSSRA